MSATLISPPAARPARTWSASARPAAPWLVGPWFDLVFVANVGWPLIVAAIVAWGPGFQSGVAFWQIYFVSTPHRWITLALVFLDRDRFRERPRAFVAVGLAVVLASLWMRLETGTLTCLLLADYLWNAWHFASQHSGILRIYTRQAGLPPRRVLLEKVLLRSFAFYVLLRSSGLAWPIVGRTLVNAGVLSAAPSHVGFDAVLLVTDGLSLLLAAGLVACVRPGLARSDRGRTIYLTSFLAFYLSLLGAVRGGRSDLVLIFTIVLALFHATEYLAIVAWAVHKRHGGRQAERPRDGNGEGVATPRRNFLAAMVPRWGLALAAFCIGLGLAGWTAQARIAESWLLLNVVVSFLHYAYDGMIWKTRRPGMVNAP